ncbi:heterokaryon incompatibility protein-domain-containing protein [Xylogone sp. PMI_703]|nr:heterokaryon incompatibility protein-domain-containing protein [Xylogone sp. PMI_703]
MPPNDNEAEDAVGDSLEKLQLNSDDDASSWGTEYLTSDNEENEDEENEEDEERVEPSVSLDALEFRSPDGLYSSSNFCEHCQELEFKWSSLKQLWQKMQDESKYFHWPTTESCPLCVFFEEARLYSCVDIWEKKGLFMMPGSPAQLYEPPESTGEPNKVNIMISPHSQPEVEGHIYGRRVLPDKINFQLLKGWISLCADNHGKNCREITPLELPYFRLIDCEKEEIIFSPKMHPDYVALSYVWGKSRDAPVPLSLSRSELLAHMPKVIEDAMFVVKNMGYRYLWVDRYCIPQTNDTPSVEIRQAHLVQMGRIYTNAEFTIVAAAGTGPDHGLPGVSVGNPRRVQPTIVVGDCLLTGVAQPRSDIDASKWIQRGWTYQEGALSRRRLVFTQTQVYFQCYDMQCVESISAPVPSGNLMHAIFAPYKDEEEEGEGGEEEGEDEEGEKGSAGGALDALNSALTINRCIKEYAGRDFTYPSDVYNAFRGVLQHSKYQKPPTLNLFGLPIMPIDIFTEHSLQSLEEDIEPPGNHARSKQFIFNESETKELTLALTWYWSTAKGTIRQKGFPSWTWLGWRRNRASRYLDDYDTFPGFLEEEKIVRNYLDSIHIEFQDSEKMPWGSNWKEICVRSENHDINCLEITGWLFKLPVNVEKGDYSLEFSVSELSAYGEDIELNFNVSKRGELLPMFRGRKQVLFTCLLLISNTPIDKAESMDITESGFLVLRELPEPATYERFDFIEMKTDDEFTLISNDRASWGSLSLQRNTIRLK